MKTIQHGFPASYNQSTQFTPLDSSKYGLDDQGADTNYGLIIVNVLFWALVLEFVYNMIDRQKTRK